jgi:hypothetical protein
MVTDQQVRRLMTRLQAGDSVTVAAAKAGMDPKTARKYVRSGIVPSQARPERTWRTRSDPFEEVWDELRETLTALPGIEAITLFSDLQCRYPGRFQDGQLRTLQRRIKVWRATEGPPKEVFFSQQHRPGDLGASDFTCMNELEITIAGDPFEHLLYHFVLTYSNWETGKVCFSESFESLSEGLQDALWSLGGVPFRHRTDRLSAAVHKLDHPEDFTVGGAPRHGRDGLHPLWEFVQFRSGPELDSPVASVSGSELRTEHHVRSVNGGFLCRPVQRPTPRVRSGFGLRRRPPGGGR